MNFYDATLTPCGDFLFINIIFCFFCTQFLCFYSLSYVLNMVTCFIVGPWSIFSVWAIVLSSFLILNSDVRSKAFQAVDQFLQMLKQFQEKVRF